MLRRSRVDFGGASYNYASGRVGGRFVQPYIFVDMSGKGLERWQLTIPTVDTKPDGTSYYNLAVRNDFMSWVATYRYSALHDFKLKLDRRFPHLRLPSFPPKTFTLFGTPGPGFLEERRAGLEAFFQGLLSDPRFHCKELKSFLDPMQQAEKGEQARQQFVSENQSRSLVSGVPSPGLESYDDVAEDSFLLPNFPPGTKIPEAVVLQSGEEIFMAPLIDEMKANIEYLWKLKRKMSGKDIDIKLSMLEDERGKINSACMVLEGERRVLESQLLQDGNVRGLAVLHTWLEFSNDKIRLALEWANHAEENLLLELSPKTGNQAPASSNGASGSTTRQQEDDVKVDLLIDLSGPAPPRSAMPPYPLHHPVPFQPPLTTPMYPPPSSGGAYYYPPYALQGPPESSNGSGAGAPLPYYYYGMPPPSHHVIPSMPGYPMSPYPQPPLTGGGGGGVLMPPASGNYAAGLAAQSAFGPVYIPASMQAPVPVSPMPLDAQDASRSQQQQQQSQPQQQQQYAYASPYTSTLPSSGSALSEFYSGAGSTTTSSSSLPLPSPSSSSSSSTTVQSNPAPYSSGAAQQASSIAPASSATAASAYSRGSPSQYAATAAASSSPSSSSSSSSSSAGVSSSFSPLPLRVGELSPLYPSIPSLGSLASTGEAVLQPRPVEQQQQQPQRLPPFEPAAEAEKGMGGPASLLSSSYRDDPFTAPITFNSSYPSEAFPSGASSSFSLGSPLPSVSFLSSPPSTAASSPLSSFTSSSSSSSSSSNASQPTTTTSFIVDSTATSAAHPPFSYFSAAASVPSSSPFSSSPSSSSSFAAAAVDADRPASPPPPYYASSSSFAPPSEYNYPPQQQQQQQQPQQQLPYYVDNPPMALAAHYAAASAPPDFSAAGAQATVGQPTYSSSADKSKKGLGERIQSYEKKAEKLVLLAVERPDKLTETEKKMKDLINKIKADQESLVAQFARRNDAEAVSQRLANILKYIQENYDLMKRFRSLYAEDQLNAFEERMYGLLSDVNGVNGHDMNEATRFHQKMTGLMREMALYHSVLRKKIEEEQKTAKAKGGASGEEIAVMNQNHLLNRLEDLQENMADFEHNFCTQYKVKRDLGDRAKQMFKQMKVKEAQQKHNVAQDSLYEL